MKRLTLILLLCCLGLLAQDKVVRFEQFDTHIFDVFLSANDSVNVKARMIFNLPYKEVRIINGEEIIKAVNVVFENDSISFMMPVYESIVHAKLNRHTSIGDFSGYWMRYPEKGQQVMKFYALNSWSVNYPPYLINDMIGAAATKENIMGRWQIIFNKGQKNEYPATGEFVQSENKISGTFATESGDYRFLSGEISGNSFHLNCFDGAHVFRFTGKINGDQISNGNFWSGTKSHQTFEGWRDEYASLRDPFAIMKINSDSLSIDPVFRDKKGYDLRLNDVRFKDKMILIQIMGTWCPNCADESRLLNDLYVKYKEKGCEIIGLAYERDDYNSSNPKLERYKNQLGLKYDVYYAGMYGTEDVSKDFPSLGGIHAFPTLLFLDQDHRLIKIHTGFYGPATREYAADKIEIENLVEQICEMIPKE